MSAKIIAAFENRDLADLAAARLHRAGLVYSSSTESVDSEVVKAPVAPRYCANLLFPFPPLNIYAAGVDTGYSRLGSKALIGRDVSGHPLVERGEVKVRLNIRNDQVEQARALLRNAGAYDIIM
ncbi:MAG: hypothetical protein GXY20_12145 [Clostridiales bacterium]|nr:hypothetical protein [Clostridiales bacterium]